MNSESNDIVCKLLMYHYKLNPIQIYKENNKIPD